MAEKDNASHVVRLDDPAPHRTEAPRRRTGRAAATVLLLGGFALGVAVSELRQAQSARTEAEARDDEVRLGAVLLRQAVDDGVVELVVQLQNRGPRTVRSVGLTIPGTPFAERAERVEQELIAGGDLEVALTAPLGCSAAGSDLVLDTPVTVLATVETAGGGRREVTVEATRPPLLDGYGTVDTTSLDRACAVVAPEQALVVEAFAGDPPVVGPDPSSGSTAMLTVRVDNRSVLPQRLLGLETPLGTVTTEREGVGLDLPLTVPGVTPPTLRNSTIRAQSVFTVLVTCARPLEAGRTPTVFVTFDAGPGTPRQRTLVQGTLGRC